MADNQGHVVLSGATEDFIPSNNHVADSVDVNGDDEIASVVNSTGGAEAQGSHSKSSRSQGVVDPDDFMAQFRKLRMIKEKAAKAAAAGPVRRVVFGDLPEWATISQMLMLVHGGAVERAWADDNQVVVQFVNEAECLRYYEQHSGGIKYLTTDEDEALISVTLPEEGLPDHAELENRVAEGASRVVSLNGLAVILKTGEELAIMGIPSQEKWNDMKFERVVITQAESGADVTISFYDMHDGWAFLQDIKEGTYDCVSQFEVDPCARASTYHFFDTNPVFDFVRG